MYERFMFDKEKPIRVVELFSGIGFQAMGMELAEVPYEVVATCEVDKFAILSYASIHTNYLNIRDKYFEKNEHTKEEMVETLQSKNVGYNFSSGRHTITKSTNIETIRDYFLADKLSNNLGDISLLKGSDFPKDIDIMTYSFPCTDLSKAGQQKGLSEDTRSGLIYEVLRLLYELKDINNLPKVPIMENVVDLIQAKFVDAWNEIAYEIETMGYTNYTFTMNAKDYGIAQTRNRVFMVSILGEYNYIQPRTFELNYRLKDYLEKEVDESYYLSDAMYGYLTSEHEKFSRKEVFERNIKGKEDDIAATITTRETNVPTSTFIDMDLVDGEDPTIIAQRGRYTENGIEQQFEVGSSDTSNALTTVQKDNYLLIPEATKQGYAEAYDGDGVYINRPHQKRGVVQDGMIQTLKTSGADVGVVVNAKKGLHNKAIECGGLIGKYNYGSSDNFMKGKDRLDTEDDIYNTVITKNNVGVAVNENGLRIRKLTPRETGRLMGMNDKQIDKQLQITSNTQAYKQHGNGIVAQVIGFIIGSLYYEDYEELKEIVLKNSFDWKN